MFPNFTKDSVDKILEEAEPRLEFGDTVMGIVTREKVKIAIGRRYFEGMELKYFKYQGILGPALVVPNQTLFAAINLERNAAKLKEDGLFHQVDAVMAVSVGVFKFLVDGLIVDNKLVKISEGVWEGKLNVNGVIYRLLALNGDTIPGHQFNFFFVDKNRQIVY